MIMMRLASCVALLLAAAPANAETVHHLTIAATDAANLSEQEADEIIKGMNAIIHSSAYGGWDTPCGNVRFERDGPILHSSSLIEGGEYQAEVNNVGKVFPAADIFAVLTLKCNGIQAVGCGARQNEPAIVGMQFRSFADQIWLHERGHNMHLLHSADTGTDAGSPKNVGMRFMFYRIGFGHTGKTQSECQAFAAMLYTSTRPGQTLVKSAMLAHPVALAMAVLPINPARSAPPAGPPAAPPPVDPAMAKQAAIAESGLTPAAFEVVGSPWVDGAPVADIQSLSSNDLDSIRALLAKPATEFTAQAATALGLAGTADDAKVLAQTLAAPMAALPPGPPSQNEVAAQRNILAAKDAAIASLGRLASRAKSDSGVKLLESAADINSQIYQSSRSFAALLSSKAVIALSQVDVPSSRKIVDKVIKASDNPKMITTPLGVIQAVKVKTGVGVLATIPIPGRADIATIRQNRSEF